jgi:hypothetical protein
MKNMVGWCGVVAVALAMALTTSAVGAATTGQSAPPRVTEPPRAQVPEPTTWAMWAAGVAALLLWTRKRRKDR